MSKFLYPIKNLKIEPWLKYWLLNKGGKAPSGVLSEIIIGVSPLTLEKSLRKKFNIFNIGGNSIQNGTPTPDNPIEVQNVSGEVSVKVENKNFFNDKLEVGSINSSGENTYNTGQSRNHDYILLKPNIEYKVSTSVQCNIGLRFYDKNKAFLSSMSAVGSPRTFTMPENAYYLRIVLTSNDTTNKVQIEQGSTATSYEPHEEQTANLTLPEGMEMCKIGDYADSFVKQNGTWYKNKNIEKLILNGTEDWTTKSTSNAKRRITLSITLPAISGSSLNVISNQLLYKTSTEVYLENEGISIGSEISLYVNEYSAESTPTSWKTHLSNTNLLVYYVLATPVLQEITDTTLIEQLDNLKNLYSYNETTYISSSNEVSPVFEVQYYMEGEE